MKKAAWYKEIRYYVFPFVPLIWGWIMSLFMTENIFFLASALIIASPFVILCVWFFIGWQYGESQMPFIQAALTGHSVGLLSLLWISWPYSESAPVGVAGAYFLPTFWIQNIISVLMHCNNYIVLFAILLIIMAGIFSLGFALGRRHIKTDTGPPTE